MSRNPPGCRNFITFMSYEKQDWSCEVLSTPGPHKSKEGSKVPEHLASCRINPIFLCDKKKQTSNFINESQWKCQLNWDHQPVILFLLWERTMVHSKHLYEVNGKVLKRGKGHSTFACWIAPSLLLSCEQVRTSKTTMTKAHTSKYSPVFWILKFTSLQLMTKYIDV